MTARPGRTLGRTIYRNGDVYLGIADTPEIATIAINALNGVGIRADVGDLGPGPWFAAGRLVYAPPAVDVLTDWIIATDSSELAAEIADAVNTVITRSGV